MDTDAIYSAVCAYGAAKCGGYILDAHEHIESVKRLLNEAEEEHKSLLDTNEKLVDKVCGLEAARIAYAREFPPIPDGDDAGLPAVDRIHENIRRLKAENAELKAELERIKPLADDTRVGILADSSYINGLRTGYVLGQAGNEDEYQKIIGETRSQISEARAAPQPEQGVPDGMVLVNRGVLNMVINALRRDAEQGREVRGEMADMLAVASQKEDKQ